MLNHLSVVAEKFPSQFGCLSHEQMVFINDLLDGVDTYRLNVYRHLLVIMRGHGTFTDRVSAISPSKDSKRADLIIAQMLPRHVPLKDYAQEWEQMKQAKQQYKGEMFHVGLVMEKYLDAGEYRGYSREEMRLIFRLMEQEDRF